MFNDLGERLKEAGADAAKFTGQQLGDAGDVRARYEDAVSGLDSSDSKGRSALKADMRQQTPTAVAEVIDGLRPDTGAQPGTSGNAANSNSRVNALGGVFKVVGPSLLLVGVAVDVYDIAFSQNTYRSMAQASFGTLGAVGGGVGGAVLGSFVTPVAGTIAGSVAGSIGGGQAGRAFGGWVFDRFRGGN